MYEITDETLNDKILNAFWSEILIKENVPCNVDIPSLLHSLFKYVCFDMERENVTHIHVGVKETKIVI